MNSYLLVSPAYPPPHIGGSKVWTFNMAENCPESLDILTSGLKEGCQEISGPRNHIIRSRYLWDSNTTNPTWKDLLISYNYILYWVFRRIRKVRYKAIVGGAFDFMNGWLILLGRFFGIPVICLGNAEEFTLALKGKGIKNWVKRNWMKFTHKKASGFIVVCHFCKDILVSIGVDPHKIEIVPSSINPQKLLSVPNRSYQGYRVLSVGRIVERKGFHFVMDAICKLKKELPEITLTIVGGGPYFSKLEQKQKDLKAEGYILLKGPLTDEELSRLYSESNLFVLAHMMLENGDTEGCPTVFSEASGCGLPVIGGMEGGASTAIVEGKTGFIVNSRNVDQLADRIKTILTQPELAKQMGQAGIQKIQREHTPEVTGVSFHKAVVKFSVIPEGASSYA